MKIQTRNIITSQDWDELVIETYGRPYNLQQQGEGYDRGLIDLVIPSKEAEDENLPDTVLEEINEGMGPVKFTAWLARDPKQPIPNQEYDWELKMWWDRDFYPTLESVANDLHAKGLLKAGRYNIEVDW